MVSEGARPGGFVTGFETAGLGALAGHFVVVGPRAVAGLFCGGGPVVVVEHSAVVGLWAVAVLELTQLAYCRLKGESQEQGVVGIGESSGVWVVSRVL